jgi:hypothetical protein
VTLSAAPTRVVYNGPSATAAFPVANGASPIVFNANSHIKASLRTTAGVVSVLVEGTDYTLTGGPSAGVLTLSAGILPTGYALAIWREQPLAQTLSIGVGGAFSSTDVNAAFDTARQVDQELDDRLDRALTMNRFSGAVAEIPHAPSTVIGQDAAGALTTYGVTVLTNAGPNYRSEIPARTITVPGFMTLDGATWIHGTSAGPMAIQDASGQWWQLDLSKGYAHASWFEAVGDGTADDAAALNTGSTALANSGYGGGILDLTGGRYLVDSADLVVHQGVRLNGPYDNFGEMGSGPNGLYSIVTSSIVVNPAYTIRLLKFASVKGLAIFRKGLTKPTNMRTAIDVGRAFAGTAITFGNGPTQASSGIASDSYVGYCLIVGFEYGILNYKNERPHIEYVSGDCTNGIYFNFVTDMDHISHVHFWPFAVAHVSGGVGVSYTVTGASDNGSGAIRLALSTNVITAGDTVIVQSVVGTTEANGRWVVSAVGSGYIDLTGSTYTNAWVSGGHVYLDNSKRPGAAFSFYNVVDWGQVDNSFCYGYDQGFVVDSCNDVVLLNCGVDGYASAADPTTVGYSWQNGALRGTMIGCKGASHGYAVVQDVGSADNSDASANLNMSGCHFWGNNQGHLHVVTGRVTSIGCHYDSIVGPLSSTAYAITVEGDSYGGIFIGNTASRAFPITFTAGNAINHSTIRHNKWPDASSVGNREVADNSQRSLYFASYGSSGSVNLVGQNARGTASAPTALSANDHTIVLRGQSYDGTTSTDSGSIRIDSDGGASAGSTPGKIIFSTTPSAAADSTDRISIGSGGNIVPVTDNAYACGGTGARWTSVWAANGAIQTSDQREKGDITPSALGLDFVNALRPVSYRWLSGGNEVVRQVYLDADGREIPDGEVIPDGATPGRIITRKRPGNRTHWGLIAQEVKMTCDAMGVDFGGWVLSDAANPDSQQALRYDQFVGPLIKAVQELTVRVKTLESKL